MIYALLILAGLVVGGGIGWLIASLLNAKKGTALGAVVAELRRQTGSAANDFETLRVKLSDEQAARVKAETQLAETNKLLAEEKKLLEEAKSKLTDAFKAIAGDALTSSTTEFLKLAKETFDKVLTEAKGDLGTRQEAIKGLVKPLSESLTKFDEHLRVVEKARQESYTGLTEQVKTLSSANQQLQKETGNLVTALRRPEVRGRWGEMTLRRVVELAGLSAHCDFCEQVSMDTEEGRMRPDLIVNLPTGRQIIVDSKVPLDAYLDANAADSEEKRREALERHAKHIRNHINGLADKRYWAQFPEAPDFVVMFIPGESFFDSAVNIDPALIEDASLKNVMLTTPITLIALMKTVAYGWRQEQMAQNTREISELGRELYDRMRKLAQYISDIGKELDRTTTAYNRAASSLETRVLPQARRFKDLGAATGEEIPALQSVQGTPRLITSPELLNEEE